MTGVNNSMYSEPWCKPLFCLLEYNSTDKDGLTWIPLQKDLHIEHIIPAAHKNYKEWDHITDEMFELWGNSGANLTLLGGSKNIEASDNPFKDKINVYKGKGLYQNKNTKVTGYNITQKIVADFDSNKYNQEWNQAAIIDRWEWFCSEVAEILQIDTEAISFQAKMFVEPNKRNPLKESKTKEIVKPDAQKNETIYPDKSHFEIGKFDLDSLISQEEQNKWLNSNEAYKFGKYQLKDLKLQKDSGKKLSDLETYGVFRSEILPFLQAYFSKCIIQPALTENRFWRISAMPDNRTLFRLNLTGHEVLTITKSEGAAIYSFHILADGITENDLIELGEELQTELYVSDHSYPSGNAKQLYIEVNNFTDAMELFKNPKIVNAIKTYNLRQMRKGSTNWPQNIELAKLILTDTVV